MHAKRNEGDNQRSITKAPALLEQSGTGSRRAQPHERSPDYHEKTQTRQLKTPHGSSLQCEEANLIRRAMNRVREHVGYDSRSHVDYRYGIATGCEEQDPADHEELADLAIALERATEIVQAGKTDTTVRPPAYPI